MNLVWSRNVLGASELSVSVLILNFNGRHHLNQHLDSVLATDYSDFRVVVIDNGSTDGSLEFLANRQPRVEVVGNRRNLGFVLAYNSAIDSVATEYFVLLNNDVSVEPGWLRALMAHAREERVAALTPKMLFYNDKRRINAAGGNCDVYGTGWNRGNSEIDKGQYDCPGESFYGNGAALLIKTEAWRDVGPFDERYFMYGEDLDWCWRARLKGYRILYVPTSRVYHLWLGSRGAIFYFLERNTLSTILKNYSLVSLLRLMPAYLTLKLLKTLWALKNVGDGNRLFTLKAIWWNAANLKETWKKRMQVQSSRSVSDAYVQRLMTRESFELLLWLKKSSHPILTGIHGR